MHCSRSLWARATSRLPVDKRDNFRNHVLPTTWETLCVTWPPAPILPSILSLLKCARSPLLWHSLCWGFFLKCSGRPEPASCCLVLFLHRKTHELSYEHCVNMFGVFRGKAQSPLSLGARWASRLLYHQCWASCLAQIRHSSPVCCMKTGPAKEQWGCLSCLPLTLERQTKLGAGMWAGSHTE